MPREVILNHGVVGLAQGDIQSGQLSGRDMFSPSNRAEKSLTSRLPPSATPKPKRDDANSPTKAKSKPIEIIEISSDSDDQPSPTKPRSAPTQLTSPLKFHAVKKTQGTPIAQTKQPVLNRRRVYIISSSSDDDNDNTPIRAPKGNSKDISRDRLISKENSTVSTIRPLGLDTQINDEGVINYVPAPRQPISLSPSKAQRKQNATPASSNSALVERRRTLLQPDPVPPVREDISWELEQDDVGGVKSGAMLVLSRDLSEGNASAEDLALKPSSSGVASTPSQNHETDMALDPSQLSSPQKTPRRKKMPEAVALLHRMAVPYLKDLDSRVFGDQLGAVHLPDIEPLPASPIKGKGRNQGAIWGMGSRGDFNDGRGSFIELVWSNRMATTAGRTEYKKSGNRQISIKIELGVKVVTSEERLRNTLAHEACHAATWAISGDFERPHGATFKKWAKKVMKAFPGVEITTKHDYEIEFKFTWKCVNTLCGQVYKRHSNSINIEEHGCHCGSKLEPQFKLPDRTPRKAATVKSKSAAQIKELTTMSPAPMRFGDLPESDEATRMPRHNTHSEDVMELSSEGEEVGLSDSAVDALALKLRETIM